MAFPFIYPLTRNTGKQSKYTKYSGSENRSFMRNKENVFGIRIFTDSKNTLLGTCSGNIGYIKVVIITNLEQKQKSA